MSGCVLCDWTFDSSEKPLTAYRGVEFFPLTWDTDGPRTVKPSESIGSTIVGLATVTHWAQTHPQQLSWALDGAEIEIDTFPRQKVYGSMAPPGGFTEDLPF